MIITAMYSLQHGSYDYIFNFFNASLVKLFETCTVLLIIGVEIFYQDFLKIEIFLSNTSTKIILVAEES